MVTTRVFLLTLSRTVITRPSLYRPAISLYASSRARNAKGIKRLFPSGRYLRFRIYTQYGNEPIDTSDLKRDIIAYLQWQKNYQ